MGCSYCISYEVRQKFQIISYGNVNYIIKDNLLEEYKRICL